MVPQVHKINTKIITGFLTPLCYHLCQGFATLVFVGIILTHRANTFLALVFRVGHKSSRMLLHFRYPHISAIEAITIRVYNRGWKLNNWTSIIHYSLCV